MDKNDNQQVTNELRQHWAQIEPQIIARYSGVTTDDLKDFSDATDLVQRISQKSGQPVSEVETQLREFATSGHNS